MTKSMSRSSVAKLEIRRVSSARLDGITRAGIERVFGEAFRSEDPGAVIGSYSGRVDSVLVAHEGERVSGFQFYQRRSVEGVQVHHFSLAGRLPGDPYRGLQARFARHVIGRAVLRTPPWKPVLVAGVTNSVRSYANLHAVGGRLYPDVTRPGTNPFADRYLRVARMLGIEPTDDSGIVPDRMAALGFALRSERPHALSAAYERFVRSRDNGLFVLTEIVPVRDLPRYVLGRGRAPVVASDAAQVGAR
jgi:hypothetical protein